MTRLPRDDFRLAVGLFYLGLGLLIIVDASGLHEMGELWYPVARGWTWLVWQQHPLFGVVVAVTGGWYLATYGGCGQPLWLRIIGAWWGWALMADLLAHRVVGFLGPVNPPWWATLGVGVLFVVLTVRRARDLRCGVDW